VTHTLGNLAFAVHRAADPIILDEWPTGMLGVEPAVGRVLATDDDATPNANPPAVLSSDFWERQLGGAPDVVGRKVLVNRHPLTIIGVAASTFKGVKRYLGGRSPLGVRICKGSGPDAKPNTEIVGVMSNFSYRGLRGALLRVR
jgi:hypothetical protein